MRSGGVNSFHTVSAAAGVALNERADLSLFARNLFNSTDRTYLLGGSNATRNSPVLFGQTFRPREIGLKATYRY